MSDCIEIAEAIKNELNLASFTVPVTAKRSLLPDFELADLAELKVTVVPKSVEFTPFSRQWTQYDYSIDIGIQKKLASDIETELLPLLDLVAEIVTYLRNRKLSTLSAATWIKTKNDPIYAADHLANQRVFTSVLTVTYRVVK